MSDWYVVRGGETGCDRRLFGNTRNYKMPIRWWKANGTDWKANKSGLSAALNHGPSDVQTVGACDEVTRAFLHVLRLSLSPKSPVHSIEPLSNKCPRDRSTGSRAKNLPDICWLGPLFFLIAQSSMLCIIELLRGSVIFVDSFIVVFDIDRLWKLGNQFWLWSVTWTCSRY